MKKVYLDTVNMKQMKYLVFIVSNTMYAVAADLCTSE